MKHSVILTGDINLLGVSDPAVPFARIAEDLRSADVVFSNLECSFYEPGTERSVEDEGFYATLKSAEALKLGGIHAIGNANNVNYGGPAIRSSLSTARSPSATMPTSRLSRLSTISRRICASRMSRAASATSWSSKP